MKRFYYFLLGFSIGGLIAYFVPPHSFEGFIIGAIIMLIMIVYRIQEKIKALEEALK